MFRYLGSKSEEKYLLQMIGTLIWHFLMDVGLYE